MRTSEIKNKPTNRNLRKDAYCNVNKVYDGP